MCERTRLSFFYRGSKGRGSAIIAAFLPEDVQSMFANKKRC